MIGLGAIAVLFGLASAWNASRFDPAAMGVTPDVQREMVRQIEDFETKTGISARTVMMVAAGLTLAGGAVLGTLGFFVRGGGFRSIVASLVLVGLAALVLAFATLVGLAQGVMASPVIAAAALLTYGVPLALMLLLLSWLVRAVRLSSKVDLARQQYQAQVTWYQRQQQQAFEQPPPAPTGLGYHQYRPPQDAAPQVPQVPQVPHAPPPLPGAAPTEGDGHGTPPER